MASDIFSAIMEGQEGARKRRMEQAEFDEKIAKRKGEEDQARRDKEQAFTQATGEDYGTIRSGNVALAADRGEPFDIDQSGGAYAKERAVALQKRMATKAAGRSRVGGANQGVQALKELIEPIQLKLKNGEDLTDDERATFDDAQRQLAAIGGSKYTAPRPAPAPAPKGPGFFERLATKASNLFSGGPAAAPAPAAGVETRDQKIARIRKQNQKQ